MQQLDKNLRHVVDSYLARCKCCARKYNLAAGIHVLEHFVCDSCVYHAGLFTLAARFGSV